MLSLVGLRPWAVSRRLRQLGCYRVPRGDSMQSRNSSLPDKHRAHQRTLCSYKCGIARYERDIHLTALKFRLVKLYDLSPGGLSFWGAQWPQHAELACVLPDHPAAGVFLVHVRSVQHVKGRYLVRCQLVRILSSSSDSLATDQLTH